MTLKEQRIRTRKEDGTETMERCGLSEKTEAGILA